MTDYQPGDILSYQPDPHNIARHIVKVRSIDGDTARVVMFIEPSEMEPHEREVDYSKLNRVPQPSNRNERSPGIRFAEGDLLAIHVGDGLFNLAFAMHDISAEKSVPMVRMYVGQEGVSTATPSESIYDLNDFQ